MAAWQEFLEMSVAGGCWHFGVLAFTKPGFGSGNPDWGHGFLCGVESDFEKQGSRLFTIGVLAFKKSGPGSEF